MGALCYCLTPQRSAIGAAGSELRVGYTTATLILIVPTSVPDVPVMLT